jgi:putative phosphonate metabolism protein
MSVARYAVYYSPPPGSALARFGAGVLGYDCFDAVEVPRPVLPAVVHGSAFESATAEPRRYGFHATLVAPFHLGEQSQAELQTAFSAFASEHPPVPIGSLEVTCIGRFVALCPAGPHPQVNEFAAVCVEAFDPFRAPLSQSDRQRRLKSGLTPRQSDLLERWGYPYVFEEFRFHMTLTGPLAESERDQIKSALAQAFEPLAAKPVELGAIALMRQDDAAARFRAVSYAPLSGKER